MVDKRKLGIDVVDDVFWGTHLSYLYLNLEDFVNTMVPYFEAGLAHNELCMWVTSKSPDEEEVRAILKNQVKDFDLYLDKGAIEILPYNKWYIIDGEFDGQRVINSWVSKVNYALGRGYDGLRILANTDWLEEKHWKQWVDYEKRVDAVMERYKMIAICNYSLLSCSPSQMTDAVLSHQFCVINKDGKKRAVANSNNSSVVSSLKKQLKEMEDFNRIAVDREIRMIELKKEIEQLKEKLKNKPS